MNKPRTHFPTVPVAVVKKIAMLDSENSMKKSSVAERGFAKETVKTEPYSVYPLFNEQKNEQAAGLEVRNGLLLHRH